MRAPVLEAPRSFVVTLVPVPDPGHARLAAAMEILLEGEDTPQEAAG